MQEILLKIWYFERGLSKSLIKVNFIFSIEPVPFHGQSYLQQKGSGTNDQSLFKLQNKFRKIPLLVIYYLTMFDDIKLFFCYSKNYICKFMQANSWHQKLFHFHLSFWVWKAWKVREKRQKCEYLENEKSLLEDEIKNIFHRFWRAIIWWKNKNLIKIADKSFNSIFLILKLY